MPSKKKKYNARFPAGRIKKIMQSDEEVGKVAQAVPIIISRTLELFVDSLLTKTLRITNSRNAKTLSPSHMKQCIMAEQRFDFLRELVKNIPDISAAEESVTYYEEDEAGSSPEGPRTTDASLAHSINPHKYDHPIQSSTGNVAEQETDEEEEEEEDSNKGGEQKSSRTYDLSLPSTSNQAQKHHHERQKCTVNSNNKTSLNGDNNNSGQLMEKRQTTTTTTTTRPLRVPATALAAETEAITAPLQERDEMHLSVGNAELLTRESNTSVSCAEEGKRTHGRLGKRNAKGTRKNNTDNICNSSSSTIMKLAEVSSATPSPSPPIEETTAFKPAPIINMDYSHKPIIKIDYSNIAMTAAASPTNETFHQRNARNIENNSRDLDQYPVPTINIDLRSTCGFQQLSPPTGGGGGGGSSTAPPTLSIQPSFNNTVEKQSKEAIASDGKYIDKGGIGGSSIVTKEDEKAFANKFIISSIIDNNKIVYPNAEANPTLVDLDEDYDDL